MKCRLKLKELASHLAGSPWLNANFLAGPLPSKYKSEVRSEFSCHTFSTSLAVLRHTADAWQPKAHVPGNFLGCSCLEHMSAAPSPWHHRPLTRRRSPDSASLRRLHRCLPDSSLGQVHNGTTAQRSRTLCGYDPKPLAHALRRVAGVLERLPLRCS